MAQDNARKIKMLKLYEMLRQDTDEDHPMPTSEACRRLSEMGIACDRRTLSQDIALLNEQGIEVLWSWVGKEKGYYIVDRSFTVPELKILIDAVQAAAFIPEELTAALIDKIADLGGSHRAEILKGNMVCFNTRKHSNTEVFRNVDWVEAAIQQQKKILFLYFDLNEHGEKIYRREGHHYVVEPVALVFNEDNYYMLVYNAKRDLINSYRVDRMDKVRLLDEHVCEKAILLRESVDEYTEQAFKMYSGEPEEVTLEFDDSLIGPVYDRFGEDTKIIRTGESTCTATVMVQISPTFWGWLFQFGSKMRIISPASVIEKYAELKE